jgi:hypothetical protein
MKELDEIKARGRYMASSTRQERAQFREDYARLTAAVQAVLVRCDEMDEDASTRSISSAAKSYPAAIIRAAIENALKP